MAEKLGIGVPGIPHSADRSFLMAPDKGGNGNLSLEEILQQQRENAEALRSRELESVETIELTTLGLLHEHEKTEGSRDEENAVNWPITTHLQQLKTQEVNMRVSPKALEGYAKAKRVEGKPGWYTKVPSSYGFEAQPIKVIDETDDNGKPTEFHFEERVKIGTKEERMERAERIEKFTREVFARLKFANLYGHLFKGAIESISNLSTLYLASRDVKPEDLKALLTLPANPEDTGETLKNEAGVEYKEDEALGRMMIDAMMIFNAVGLSEKPGLFKQFVSEKGFRERILNINNSAGSTEIPPSLVPPPRSSSEIPLPPNVATNEIFKKWFGNPKQWKEEVKNDGSWRNKNMNELRTKETWESEETDRGILTKEGNIFVRTDSFEMPRGFREKVTKFLGNSETAKQAVDLAWKYFRLFAAADTVGYEWYYDSTSGTIHASIPLGGDLTSDFGKVVHPDAYLEYYHDDSRGGVPRGEYGKIEPFATDVLRALHFGKNYQLPDGTVLEDKTSLYDLLFKHGVDPKDINYDKLPDRAIIGPYLRFFMAAAGSEYGKGSFDIMTDKITSPEPYLSPDFWQTLKKKLSVGITAENVAWNRYLKSGGSESFRTATKEEVNYHVLESIRVMLDGIFAEEVSKKWDSEASYFGPDPMSDKIGGVLSIKNVAGRRGVPSPEKNSDYMSYKIIEAANKAIPDLKYSEDRLVQVRRSFNIIH